jgi:O-antigen biosynthesis protein WbqV
VTDAFSPAEIDALIGQRGHRARATLGPADRAALAGTRVMVTGAGGSIGSELARVLAACEPATLALVDHSEFALFNIEREVRGRWPDIPVEPWLMDVSRAPAVAKACRETRPHVVYHAAAYKHVTMAERAPAAALGVNVVGAAATASAAAAVGARFVLISSDKAADPKGVMGATKRLAEMIVLAMASPTFRPVVVRFGNVLGSSGSALPLMREAIRSGRPIQLTDPDATRFFMTVGEAVSLVVRADLIGNAARIFWLDMGEPVRMGDLVDRLLDLEEAAGFPRVPVEVVGLRPGEKRTETLADAQLVLDRTGDASIRVARELPARKISPAATMHRVRRAVRYANDRAALDVLSAALEGFAPSPLAEDRAGREDDEAAGRPAA